LTTVSFDLERFVKAQDRGDHQRALRELGAGRKTGHWIWYILPQLRELGRSSTAIHYGLDGVEEAEAYLSHPVLRQRLGETVAVIHDQVLQHAPPLAVLMGSGIDALKLVSCLTLFEAVARDLDLQEPRPDLARLAAQVHDILEAAEAQGYARCPATLQRPARRAG
jgi:uncharacterized protein (DUF1810 family)